MARGEAPDIWGQGGFLVEMPTRPQGQPWGTRTWGPSRFHLFLHLRDS